MSGSHQWRSIYSSPQACFLHHPQVQRNCGVAAAPVAKMAQSYLLLWALFLSSFVKFSAGSLLCEDLAAEDCAFSVSSSGARCILEKLPSPDGLLESRCQTSTIISEKGVAWIETDECIEWCGLSRLNYGLSTDVMLEKENLEMLCSQHCLSSCDNIWDLYNKLAAGEGIYLPQICRPVWHEGERRRSLRIDDTEVAPISPQTF